jgi:hypothetical protein
LLVLSRQALISCYFYSHTFPETRTKCFMLAVLSSRRSTGETAFCIHAMLRLGSKGRFLCLFYVH